MDIGSGLELCIKRYKKALVETKAFRFELDGGAKIQKQNQKVGLLAFGYVCRKQVCSVRTARVIHGLAIHPFRTIVVNSDVVSLRSALTHLTASYYA